MVHLSNRGAVGTEHLRSLRVNRVNSRSDLFPRLVAMQKLTDARNFAVFG